MRQSVGIFFGALAISFFLFFVFTGFFVGGSEIETILLSIGTTIILLLCYLISIIHYLIKSLGITEEKPNVTVFSVDHDESED